MLWQRRVSPKSAFLLLVPNQFTLPELYNFVEDIRKLHCFSEPRVSSSSDRDRKKLNYRDFGKDVAFLFALTYPFLTKQAFSLTTIWKKHCKILL